MKRIINNLLYNTDSARHIAEWTNGADPEDPQYIKEVLYRKKTKEFFLLGEGGSSTRYAITHGNNQWEKSETIIPLTDEAAVEWAKEKLGEDRVGEIFDENIGKKAADKKYCTFFISSEADRLLRVNAEREGKRTAQFLEELIFKTLE